MIWIILLIILLLICMNGVYRANGENYSAGRGMFTNSENNLPENKNSDFSDYDPYEYKNLRK